MEYLLYFKKGYDYFTTSDSNDTILDPLSMLLRLSLMKHLPEGSKISIYNNRIAYNESAFYQGLIRSFNGDRRDDLHNLFHPIICATEWYQVSDNNIKNIFTKAKEGILTLKDSYEENSIIYHTLNLYCNILEKTCNDESIEELIKDYTGKDKNPLEEEIKKIWNYDEIKIVSLLLNNIDATTDEIKKTNISAIEEIITGKEKKLNDIITEKSNVL